MDDTAEKGLLVGTNPLKEVHQITCILRKCMAKGLFLDIESTAVDIWIELWQKQKPICFTHVKNRFIDLLRRYQTRREVPLHRKDSGELIFEENLSTTEHSFEEMALKDLINGLMKCPLTSTEQMLIWYRFWKGYTPREIASDQNLSRSIIEDNLNTALIKLRKFGAVTHLLKDEKNDK